MDCLTSAVSCRWASLAAPKCWVNSSFSTANCNHQRQNGTAGVNHTLSEDTRYLTLNCKRRQRLHTSLAFFWRSTIWERRCVISSCCLEASSLFLASSSAKEETCRLASPEKQEQVFRKNKNKSSLLTLTLLLENEEGAEMTVIENSVNTVKYSRSSLTQSLTSCCSFSSYEIVSVSRWLAWKKKR